MAAFNKIKNTIIKYDMISEGDSILVAFSGGPDSVALLDCLKRMRKNLKLTLYAVYINHNMRPTATAGEENFCRDFCRRNKIHFFLVKRDIPSLASERKKGLEETAREERYRIFEELLVSYNIKLIALGHHYDDRVETVIFRIIRGTGLSGLKGIPPKRDKIIRPLYDLTKTEILDYLKSRKLSYCFDRSNLNSDFKRNYIRNILLPQIQKNLNPAVDKAIINLSEIATAEESHLDKITSKKTKKILKVSQGNKFELALNKFKEYDIWLRRRILRHCLSKLSEEKQMPDKIVVDRLDELCFNKQKAASLPGNIQAEIIGNKLVIYKKVKYNYNLNIIIGEILKLPYPQLFFKSKILSRFKTSFNYKRLAGSVKLDYNKIAEPLYVRNIQDGDRFRPLGMKGTKKIGDYLTDKKILKVYRDEIPVLCDQKGIIWLVGVEIADRVKIDEETGKVLKIEVSQWK